MTTTPSEIPVKVCYHGDPCLCADEPDSDYDEGEEIAFEMAAAAEATAERYIESRYSE